jgi:hypothetical protein
MPVSAPPYPLNDWLRKPWARTGLAETTRNPATPQTINSDRWDMCIVSLAFMRSARGRRPSCDGSAENSESNDQVESAAGSIQVYLISPGMRQITWQNLTKTPIAIISRDGLRSLNSMYDDERLGANSRRASGR